MAFEKFNSLSFLLLAIMASVFTQHAFATSLDTSSFCKYLKDKDLCSTMIDGATNWHDAIGNAINATLSVANELQSKSGFVAASIANLPPSTKETCKESFQTTTDMLHEALDHLAAGDNGSLHTKLSAALDVECADELSNLGVASPISNMVEDLHKKVSVCLAIMTQNENVTA
ncbi:unnamed protein product [Fraxinus pennsylvanica]|uniref:Pectinesterase inhibitor domain-containing protein n=1 Tax=Fraxinus pennsylvanica TaxID=56036 RepID=A0AAD2DM21_9LAMI|nr:unnamed protein product [Fraxinus pennsylvanica]